MKFKLRLAKNGQALIRVFHKGHSFIVSVYARGDKPTIARSMLVHDVVQVYEKDASIGHRVILVDTNGPNIYRDVFGSDRIDYVGFTRKLLEFAERKLDK